MNKAFKTLSVAALFLPLLTSWASEGVFIAPIQQSVVIASSHAHLNEYVGGDLILTQDQILLARPKQGVDKMIFKIIRRETDTEGRLVTFGIQVPHAESLGDSPMPAIEIIDSSLEVKILYTTEVLKKGERPSIQISELAGGGFDRLRIPRQPSR